MLNFRFFRCCGVQPLDGPDLALKAYEAKLFYEPFSEKTNLTKKLLLPMVSIIKFNYFIYWMKIKIKFFFNVGKIQQGT